MSKSLKKLIDINRLREFKNKLVGAGSAYVQTGAVDQTVAGTKTFSKPIVGSVTGSSGSCTGNAATATTAATAEACTGNAATATRANSAANADTATNATNSNAANQLQAFVNDDFTGGNHYVKAIRSSLGWSTHLWMCYNNGAKMADEVSVNYANSAGNAATATKATQDSDGNQINTTYSKNGHTHDDRYYTEAEVNNLLAGKANSSHAHPYIPTSASCNKNWHWEGRGGQPSWLWGGEDGTNMYVYNPSNFSVNYANSAGSATKLTQWYAAYPDGAEAHNAMWGGRDITAAFNNGTVSANIANGTFKDIFPGDYITKQVTIPRAFADDGVTVIFEGGTYTVNWVVTDCDYWINKGDTAMTAHHVAIVPQALIFDARMNPTNTTAGGYAGSDMYRKIIPACARGIVHAFGFDHILEFRDSISHSVDISYVSSGLPQVMGTPGWWGEWVSVYCNLMSEKMVYGAPICSAGAVDNVMATRQMSAFRLSEKLINCGWWWLRDVAFSQAFALVYSSGDAHAEFSSGPRGVRPFALLK